MKAIAKLFGLFPCSNVARMCSTRLNLKGFGTTNEKTKNDKKKQLDFAVADFFDLLFTGLFSEPIVQNMGVANSCVNCLRGLVQYKWRVC